MKQSELKAILTLLDDPDREIFDSIYQTFIGKGIQAISDLEMAWELTSNLEVKNKIEEIIHRIQHNYIHSSLSAWVANGATNLLEGAFIVSKYQYPDLDLQDLEETIELIKNDAQKIIKKSHTPIEKIRIVNQIIYDTYHFSTNLSGYSSPQNAYINQVLISKKGNPISLGIIYATVAQKLGLPVFGVNLPKNFILAYKDESLGSNLSGNASDVLFYINPFNRGVVLNREEIDQFLQKQNIHPDEHFYRTCSNVEIIQRLLLNLIYAYEKLGYQQKIKDLQVLLKISKTTITPQN